MNTSTRCSFAALWITLLLLWPRPVLAQPAVVNDITQLNPITVEKIVVPQTIQGIRDLVQQHHGPISIGGGRFSMGGQIATDNSLFIDMRGMDHVVAFSPENQTITVEAGITWRKIQEVIDPHGLAVMIMQSYANFTVGGSLSVNSHGRYIGQGPLIGSVRALKIVLADGQLIEASPTQNAELFFGCIGGYGGLGIIVEATLALAENRPIEREVRTLKVTEYKEFFFSQIRNAPRAVFHNGDLYPPRYDTVRAITWSETDRPVTIPDHLMPVHGATWVDRLSLFGVSELPFGKELRAKVLDPLRLKGKPVVWRNYEASYDVSQLEPGSRASSTYVLQEYFVPVARFDDFVPQMTQIFQQHHVNVINVSIRHAKQDPGSLLAWAREECFAFVVYYKQGVQEADREAVGVWTRALIDAALAVGGSYYLPYQIHATDEQFRRAYPRAEEFFALKHRVDPDHRFRNKLWDRYDPPPPPTPTTSSATPSREDTATQVHALKHYLRSEDQTYLTLPEWYIVYSADEYATLIEQQPPSRFPFFRSISQFWSIYGSVLKETWSAYPFNWGYNVMIGVIGTSYTVEYAIGGLYESSVGWLTEHIARLNPAAPETAEDAFLREAAKEYAAFIHATPWYAFPYAQKMSALWKVPAAPGASVVRKWERRLSYTPAFAVKSVWGWLMNHATQTTYEPEQLEVQAWVRNFSPALIGQDSGVRVLAPPNASATVLTLPRYEPFTKTVRELTRHGVQFIDIAGNHTIVATLIAPSAWKDTRNRGQLVGEWDILTDPDHKRIVLAVAVDRLHEVLPSLEAEQLQIEHLYDY